MQTSNSHEKCCGMKPDSKYRDWIIVLNNYDEVDEKRLHKLGILKEKGFEKSLKYMVVGKEVGEKGTKHLQMFFSFFNAKSLGAIRKLISLRANYCVRSKGSPETAAKYCMKGEQSKIEWTEHGVDGPNFGLNADFAQYGDIPTHEQGKRTDLIKIKDDILNGTKVDDLVLENPMLFHQYGRTLNKIEDLRLRKQFRSWKTDCLWIYGPTGCKKSERVFTGFSPETHYVKSLWKKDLEWWDDYVGQEIVIFDDYRGQMPYDVLLRLTDRYPFTVPRRGREGFPFLAKMILITSCSSPETIYHNTAEKEDSINQLLRRITVESMGYKNIAELTESSVVEKIDTDTKVV